MITKKITKKVVDEARKDTKGRNLTKRDNMLMYMVFKILFDETRKSNKDKKIVIRHVDRKLDGRIFLDDTQVIPVIVEREKDDGSPVEYTFYTKALRQHKDKDVWVFVLVDKFDMRLKILGALTTKEIYSRGDFNLMAERVRVSSKVVNNLHLYLKGGDKR